jgi:hypothetical protein
VLGGETTTGGVPPTGAAGVGATIGRAGPDAEPRRTGGGRMTEMGGLGAAAGGCVAIGAGRPTGAAGMRTGRWAGPSYTGVPGATATGTPGAAAGGAAT